MSLEASTWKLSSCYRAFSLSGMNKVIAVSFVNWFSFFLFSICKFSMVANMILLSPRPPFHLTVGLLIFRSFSFGHAFLWGTIVVSIGIVRVSCPSVKLRVPGDFLNLVCPCLPLQPLLAGWGFPYPLLVPVAPLQPLLVGFSFLEETCVMRPWHHQAANS